MKELLERKAGDLGSNVLLCLLLCLTVLAVYLQVVDHEFVFDDIDYVTHNPHVASGITGNNIWWAITSTHSANWHPVTWLSHMTDVQFFGLNPRGHHLTNIIIHSISSVLLLLLLRRVTGLPWQSSFVAALFALHPMHVESVAWVAERKDILSAFFFFLTLLFYAEYIKKKNVGNYILALLSFIMGLMSKQMLVTLPLVMLLMDFWPFKRLQPGTSGEDSRCISDKALPLLREKIPFFVSAILSGIITLYAQNKFGAIKSLYAIPLELRVENALIAYVTYLFKTLWPHDLAVLYPFPSSFPFWQISGSLLVLLLVSAMTLLLRRRFSYLLAGWLWYLVTLVPVIGLIQVGNQAMADRYSYLPSIGLYIMAAWGVSDLMKNNGHKVEILTLLAGVAVIASTTLTWRQLGYWRDNISLYQHTLRLTTGNYLIHYNLGLAFAEKGNLNDAIREYEEALRIRPTYADAHYDLGVALANRGDLDAAIVHYRKAIEIKQDNTDAHVNLGIALASKGWMDIAIQEFQEALRINPDNALAYINLGVALARKGQMDMAIQMFQAALRIDPNNKDIRSKLELIRATKRITVPAGRSRRN